jgi:hypothetical protein
MDKIKETRAHALQVAHEIADNEIKEAKDRLDRAVELLSYLESVAITHEERLAIAFDWSQTKGAIKTAKEELKDCIKKKLELPVE